MAPAPTHAAPNSASPVADAFEFSVGVMKREKAIEAARAPRISATTVVGLIFSCQGNRPTYYSAFAGSQPLGSYLSFGGLGSLP